MKPPKVAPLESAIFPPLFSLGEYFYLLLPFAVSPPSPRPTCSGKFFSQALLQHICSDARQAALDGTTMELWWGLAAFTYFFSAVCGGLHCAPGVPRSRPEASVLCLLAFLVTPLATTNYEPSSLARWLGLSGSLLACCGSACAIALPHLESPTVATLCGIGLLLGASFV